MGDRANIAVRTCGKSVHEPGACVVFYTHWRGSDVPEVVRDSLSVGHQQWNDPPYLARIVFCQLIGRGTDGASCGIDTTIGDNEYPLLVIDCIEQKVVMFSRKDAENGGVVNGAGHAPGPAPTPLKQWSFEEFSKLDFKDAARGGWATIDPKDKE